MPKQKSSTRESRASRLNKKVEKSPGDPRKQERIAALIQLATDAMNAVREIERKADTLGKGLIAALDDILSDEANRERLNPLLEAAENYANEATLRRQDVMLSQRLVRKAWCVVLGTMTPAQATKEASKLRAALGEHGTGPSATKLRSLLESRGKASDINMVGKIYGELASGSRAQYRPDTRGIPRGKLLELINEIRAKLGA